MAADTSHVVEAWVAAHIVNSSKLPIGCIISTIELIVGQLIDRQLSVIVGDLHAIVEVGGADREQNLWRVRQARPKARYPMSGSAACALPTRSRSC
jgi:hypothetical protein